jgi:restriction system protein
MWSFSPLLPAAAALQAAVLSELASLTISSLIIPERRVEEGVLINSTSTVWAEIVSLLSNNWDLAKELSSEKWEEIIAGAFRNYGFDEVILTPRSGDKGRDVIATRHGVGCVKIIGSVKANRPGNLVSYDDVRALLGVMSGERDVSKGIIATTSDFPPRIHQDPFIAPFLPTRLELMNGTQLHRWLTHVNAEAAGFGIKGMAVNVNIKRNDGA